MSNSASFTVSYDGSALETHKMDVRDLGPALLSVGQLFDEANRVLNGDKVSVKLQVKAHTEGSFEIIFEAIQTFSSQLSGFLTGDFVSSALNLKDLVLGGGTGVYGLFKLIKKLKGGKPKKIIDLRNGFVRIEIDGETFEVPLNLLRLYQDISVRNATERVLRPLESEGIDTFTIKDGKENIEQVKKNEVQFFKTPEIQDERITQFEHESSYSIVSLAFKEDNKWRLFDGNSTIVVSIKDEDFIRKVNDDLISFSKGDILSCKVRTSQWKTNTGLRTEYEVLKVNDHMPAARQIDLFDFDQTKDDNN